MTREQSVYDQALLRIRGEYLEMPGMRLTPEQVQRLSGIELSLCKQVLADLVRSNFLRLNSDATYVFFSDESVDGG